MIAAPPASSAPTTMRSGYKKSVTAAPSRRNSGLETTENAPCGAPFKSKRVAQPLASTHRNGAFFDDDFWSFDGRRDFISHCLDIGQVRFARLRLRRADGNEHRVRLPNGVRYARRKTQSDALVSGQQLRQALFMDRSFPALERGYFGAIVVHRNYLVSDFRETSRRNKSHVTRSNHRDARHLAP